MKKFKNGVIWGAAERLQKKGQMERKKKRDETWVPTKVLRGARQGGKFERRKGIDAQKKQKLGRKLGLPYVK